MSEQRIGIIMNGVTGRMGKNQHLVRSVKAIMDEGGLLLPGGDRLMPDPILVGRNPTKMEALARETGIERWSTSLDDCLENPDDSLYFDAVLTQHRAENIKKAIAAGKHIYTEKPTAESLEDALELGPTRASSGRQKRRGSRQAVSARPSETQTPGRRGLFRAHPLGTGRVWLLGVRGRLAGGAAPQLELPQGGGRRHHYGHALPLALRAGQHLRAG